MKSSSKSKSVTVCSYKGCNKKLRSNSKGDTCYEHRNTKLNTAREIERINKVNKKPKHKPTIKDISKYLSQLDILFLIIDPSRKCIPKFFFVDTVEVNIFRFFKALSKIRHSGSSNLGITIGGLAHVSAKRPLKIDDIEVALNQFMPEVKRIMPALPPFTKFDSSDIKVYTLKGDNFVLSSKGVVPRDI